MFNRVKTVQTLRSLMLINTCFSEGVLVIVTLLYLCSSYFFLVRRRIKFTVLNVGIVVQRTRAMSQELFAGFLPGSFTGAGISKAITSIYFLGN